MRSQLGSGLLDISVWKLPLGQEPFDTSDNLSSTKLAELASTDVDESKVKSFMALLVETSLLSIGNASDEKF